MAEFLSKEGQLLLPIKQAEMAASFIDAENAFRRIMGYQDLWMLKAHLDALNDEKLLTTQKR